MPNFSYKMRVEPRGAETWKTMGSAVPGKSANAPRGVGMFYF